MAIKFIDLEKAKRNDDGNTGVDGGPRGGGQDGGEHRRGHEEQSVMWTGSVRRVQSKRWRDTGERFDPIFFNAVELISRQICTKDILQKLLYAYGLSVVADGEATLQEQVTEWKDIFSRHGLRRRRG